MFRHLYVVNLKKISKTIYTCAKFQVNRLRIEGPILPDRHRVCDSIRLLCFLKINFMTILIEYKVNCVDDILKKCR